MLIAAGVPLALAAAGALYQSIATRREARRFPPPGQLVDVGGRRLHVICIGEGEPVVIFESSAFGNALSASKARAEIAAKTRVCSYDRMGTGWSDPGPPEISVGTLADDLGRLAERAGIRPPFVLVPASIGGLTVELFARRHPERVAGMVFVDAASSAGVERLLPNVTWLRTRAVCLAPLAARVGLLRAIDPFDLRQTGGEAEARAVALDVSGGTDVDDLRHGERCERSTAQEFRAAPPLRSDVPLTVLSAETNVGLLPRGFGAGGLLSCRRAISGASGAGAPVVARPLADGAGEHASHRQQSAARVGHGGARDDHGDSRRRPSRGIPLKAITAGACLLVGAFVVARAVLVPLTYDEAASYLRYISQDFLSVFNFEVATNHFLNTLLTRLAFVAAGDREIVLRLGGLIGYGLYLTFSVLILRDLPASVDRRGRIHLAQSESLPAGLFRIEPRIRPVARVC